MFNERKGIVSITRLSAMFMMSVQGSSSDTSAWRYWESGPFIYLMAVCFSLSHMTIQVFTSRRQRRRMRMSIANFRRARAITYSSICLRPTLSFINRLFMNGCVYVVTIWSRTSQFVNFLKIILQSHPFDSKI